MTLVEEQMNVNIGFPNNLIFGEDSYDIYKNDTTGSFYYLVHAKTAGLYTIYSDKLDEDWTFKINHNVPYVENMKAYLVEDNIVAG